MIEYIIVIILLLILIVLIYCARLLKYTIEMKKVVFEWEHGKEDSFALDRSGNLTTAYEKAQWQYHLQLQGIKNKKFREEYEATEQRQKQKMELQQLEYAAEHKRKQAMEYATEQRQEKIRNVGKFLSRITGVFSRKKD